MHTRVVEVTKCRKITGKELPRIKCAGKQGAMCQESHPQKNTHIQTQTHTQSDDTISAKSHHIALCKHKKHTDADTDTHPLEKKLYSYLEGAATRRIRWLPEVKVITRGL